MRTRGGCVRSRFRMRGSCEGSLSFVGWAKRSVPTNGPPDEMVGTVQARLCPPYDSSLPRPRWWARSASPTLRLTVIASQAKNPFFLCAARWIASLAMTWMDMTSPSRDALRPSFAAISAPIKNRGRREGRAPAGTRGLVCQMRIENAHEHTGVAETSRPSLRDGFTAYSALSPATNSSCHRRRRINGSSIRLGSRTPPPIDTSNGCQDHTALPYAIAPLVLRALDRSRDPGVRPAIASRARRFRVHRIPAPTSVTIAIRPSCGTGWREL